MMATSNSSKRAMHSQITPPRKIFNTKNWLTVTMMKYQEKNASRDLAAAKTMSIKSTVAGAVAAVASWKMLTQENLEVESAGIASRY
jgi:hypothetical protein